MKVLIYCKVWKRPRVTQICYLGILRMQDTLEEFGIETEVLIVASEDDHVEMALKHGFNVFSTENSPVGTKQNYGLIKSLDYDYDFLLEMGSNNLVSDSYIDRWVIEAMKGTALFGSNVFHCVLKNKEITKFKCRKRRLSGVGRGIRRDILEKVYDQAGILCEPQKKKGLDGSTRMLIEKYSGEIPTVIAEGEDLVIIDIKTGEDINEHTTARGAKATRLVLDDLKNKFPEVKHLFI